MLLINSYDDYKDLPDCEDQLCLLFTKMNLHGFAPKDIKKRIKHLKLEDGKDRALGKFNLIYTEADRVRMLCGYQFISLDDS